MSVDGPARVRESACGGRVDGEGEGAAGLRRGCGADVSTTKGAHGLSLWDYGQATGGGETAMRCVASDTQGTASRRRWVQCVVVVVMVLPACEGVVPRLCLAWRAPYYFRRC